VRQDTNIYIDPDSVKAEILAARRLWEDPAAAVIGTTPPAPP
jgi:hypothetical protein